LPMRISTGRNGVTFIDFFGRADRENFAVGHRLAVVRFRPFRNKAVFIPKTYEPKMAAANGHMGDFAGLEVR